MALTEYLVFFLSGVWSENSRRLIWVTHVTTDKLQMFFGDKKFSRYIKQQLLFLIGKSHFMLLRLHWPF